MSILTINLLYWQLFNVFSYNLKAAMLYLQFFNLKACPPLVYEMHLLSIYTQNLNFLSE